MDGTLIVLAILFAYIIFPIWAMKYTSDRGNGGWAVAIFLLSFIGFGPVVALLGVLNAANKPLEVDLIDHHQRQCPNCGGFKVNGRRATTKTKTYTYLCHLCGYQWVWQSDQPWPQVNVRPDLIAKGEQKLEEEAAAQRKRDEEAAALYYLTHKK